MSIKGTLATLALSSASSFSISSMASALLVGAVISMANCSSNSLIRFRVEPVNAIRLATDPLRERTMSKLLGTPSV